MLLAVLLFGSGCDTTLAPSDSLELSQADIESVNGEHAAYWREAAYAAYQRGEFYRCASIYLTIGQTIESNLDSSYSPESIYDRDSLYNAACCAALAGRIELAIHALRFYAIAHGWQREQILADTDLVSLRHHPAWNAVLQSVDANRSDLFEESNRELAMLFEASRLDASKSMARARYRARVHQRRIHIFDAIADNPARTEPDFIHLATIMSASGDRSDIEKALAIATEGMATHPKSKRLSRLAALLEDTLAVREGRPQRWGTAPTRRSGLWTIGETDPSVSDKERIARGLPPLRVQEKVLGLRNVANRLAPVQGQK